MGKEVILDNQELSCWLFTREELKQTRAMKTLLPTCPNFKSIRSSKYYMQLYNHFYTALSTPPCISDMPTPPATSSQPHQTSWPATHNAVAHSFKEASVSESGNSSSDQTPSHHIFPASSGWHLRSASPMDTPLLDLDSDSEKDSDAKKVRPCCGPPVVILVWLEI